MVLKQKFAKYLWTYFINKFINIAAKVEKDADEDDTPKTPEKPKEDKEKTPEKIVEEPESEPADKGKRDPVIDLENEEKEKELKALHKTSSIFLRNLAPTITKAEVEAVINYFIFIINILIV